MFTCVCDFDAQASDWMVVLKADASEQLQRLAKPATLGAEGTSAMTKEILEAGQPVIIDRPG